MDLWAMSRENKAKELAEARYQIRAAEIRGLLKAAEIAKGHATCGCNNEQGYCAIDDTAHVIEDDIRAEAKKLEEGE